MANAYQFYCSQCNNNQSFYRHGKDSEEDQIDLCRNPASCYYYRITKGKKQQVLPAWKVEARNQYRGPTCCIH